MDYRMTGIGTTVIPNNQIVLVGQQINNLTLSLVAPLQTDDTSTDHCDTCPKQ